MREGVEAEIVWIVLCSVVAATLEGGKTLVKTVGLRRWVIGILVEVTIGKSVMIIVMIAELRHSSLIIGVLLIRLMLLMLLKLIVMMRVHCSEWLIITPLHLSPLLIKIKLNTYSSTFLINVSPLFHIYT